MRYARKCDITGEGMDSGFVVLDSMYIKHQDDLVRWLREEYKDKIFIDYEKNHYFYSSLIKDDAELIRLSYENQIHYWTEWEDDEYEYFQASENAPLVSIDDVEFPFDKWETFYTIEEDVIVRNTWDSDAEEAYLESPERKLYATLDEAKQSLSSVCNVDGLIDNAIKYFNFDKVHQAMKAVDWCWANEQGGMHVPSSNEIKRSVAVLCELAIAGKTTVKTGGLCVSFDGDTLDIQFILTESKARL